MYRIVLYILDFDYLVVLEKNTNNAVENSLFYKGLQNLEKLKIEKNDKFSLKFQICTHKFIKDL